MKIDISRFTGRFRQEACDNLNLIDAAVVELDKVRFGGRQFDDAMSELMRLTHALKGGARMLGFQSMNALCHSLEEFLIALRRHGRAAQAQIDLIVEGRKAVERLVNSPSEPADQKPEVWLEELLARLAVAVQIAPEGITEPNISTDDIEKTGLEQPPAATPVERTGWQDSSVRVNVEAIDDILLYGYELTQSLDGLRKTHRRLDRMRLELDARLNAAGASLQPFTQSEMTQYLQNLTNISLNLRERIAEVDRNVRQIDSHASELRMRPISELFETIPLQVRELTRGRLKEVDVEFSGETVRLDGRIVELLREPMLHIIRNAIDHGLETVAERANLGKPPRGRLTLSAFENAGWARIIIADDGAGIDLHYVWQRAKELGLTQERPNYANLREGFRFLFDDHYTSRNQATDISGRGVGMAAVKRRMQELRGDVMVESMPGFGTKISLAMPTSLSSQHALIVQSHLDSEIVYYGLPTALVKETSYIRRVAFSSASIQPREDSKAEAVSLSQLLSNRITRPCEFEQYSVLCSDGEHIGALAVEKIIAESEVVVHPLPDVARRAELIAGAAALTTEEMMLILNIPAVLAKIANSMSM